MTAPRLPLRIPLAQRKPGQMDPPTHPEPMDIPAVESELDAWVKRGGRVDPGNRLGGETQYPGGLYGGEFSDEDDAAYLDAAKKIGYARAMQHLLPLFQAAHGMAAKPDATAVTPDAAPDLSAQIADMMRGARGGR